MKNKNSFIDDEIKKIKNGHYRRHKNKKLKYSILVTYIMFIFVITTASALAGLGVYSLGIAAELPPLNAVYLASVVAAGIALITQTANIILAIYADNARKKKYADVVDQE